MTLISRKAVSPAPHSAPEEPGTAGEPSRTHWLPLPRAPTSMGSGKGHIVPEAESGGARAHSPSHLQSSTTGQSGCTGPKGDSLPTDEEELTKPPATGIL